MQQRWSFNKWCWNNWTFTCMCIHTHTHLRMYRKLTKINSKLIIDLNVKCQNTKTPRINIGENLHDPGDGKKFLDVILKTQSMK